MNLFDSKAEALINTVNCVGVMGKGVALKFKQKYPHNYSVYKEVCNNKQLKIGTCLTIKEEDRFIINFPTKQDWKNSSTLDYISQGLEALKRHIVHYNIKSVALPKLGCNHGGLDWNIVHKMIIDALDPLVEDKNCVLNYYDICEFY